MRSCLTLVAGKVRHGRPCEVVHALALTGLAEAKQFGGSAQTRQSGSIIPNAIKAADESAAMRASAAAGALIQSQNTAGNAND